VVLAHPVTVTGDLLAWLVRAEGLGELHPVLRPAVRWVPRAGHEEVEGRYREELGRFGAVDRRGRLDVEVLASLAVLCRGATEFWAFIEVGGAVRGVLVAAVGAERVLAIRDANSVWLSQVRQRKLVEALVAQAPEVAAGRCRVVTVRRSDLLTTRAGRQRTATGVILRPADAAVLEVQRVAALRHTGGGEMFVGVRDGAGGYRMVDQPLRYVDTKNGRFLNRVMTEAGEARVRVGPGGRADLVRQLMEMHRSLVR
jgi:hypothetical protein